MDITVAFEPILRLLFPRSRLLFVNARLDDWHSAEACSIRTIVSLTLRCFSGVPSPCGASMIIFCWIVVGTIGASTLVALLCYRRSDMTLSDVVEVLEKHKASPAQRAPQA
jgi:phosphatidylserine synthase